MDDTVPNIRGPFADEAQFRQFKIATEEGDPGVTVERLNAPDGRIFARLEPRRGDAKVATAMLGGAAAGAAAGAAVGGPPGAALGAMAGAVVGAVAGSPAKPRLGKLSATFESGNRGPGTVSSGKGDAGGVSYGLYQMTSKGNGGTVARFVGHPDFPHKARFAGLVPGSDAFTAAWKALAAEDPEGFGDLQHEFIERTHYAPAAASLRAATGLDVASRSAALRDVLWSAAVQHGPGTGIVSGCCRSLLDNGSPQPADGKAFDKALIEAVFLERGRKDAQGVLVHFSRNSQAVQNGVAARFVRESRDALAMLAKE